MNKLQSALSLAEKGFHVFPLIENGKTPAIDGFPVKATRDPEQIKSWWTCPVTGWEQDFNVGVSTSKFNGSQALLVVDVDTKNGKDGNAELLRLEMEGKVLPPTLEARTPTGGRHIFYVVDAPVRQGVNTLGDGLDTRSKGGYVCGVGSITDKGEYVFCSESPIASAPDWLVTQCGPAVEKPTAPAPQAINPDRAHQRAIHYLQEEAPHSVEGDGGDQTAFVVAAKVKDFGVTEADAVELLLDHWNDRCEPPWTPDEIADKVANAYRYGREKPGAAAPEADFEPHGLDIEPHEKAPVSAMNDEFAFIKRGAFIIQETTNHKGQFIVEHLSQQELHGWHANKQISIGKSTRPISQVWLEWKGRREFEGVVFAPERDLGPRWYNLWRGFRVAPAATSKHPAVEMFVEHALHNVCGGDKQLCRWLMGYFAHMIQRPWEKPLVALVFKGKKGTGKNALVERVGYLLGGHFMVADDDRYLTSNFNSHLEACLFMVLDEAAWAGDKRAEGKLKGLITGNQHNIERKGKEPYSVDNLTRIAIIGNEDWLVPASHDERRFAVFNLGEGRLQDREFFKAMREGMEAGGYAHLLRYFMDVDLSHVDVNGAPHTIALLDQKLASLDPLHQWWHDSLEQGRIVGFDFDDDWPQDVACDRLRDAYAAYAKKRNVRSRIEDYRLFGKELKRCAPGVHPGKKREGNKAINIYKIPPLTEARVEWDTFIGHEQEWLL